MEEDCVSFDSANNEAEDASTVAVDDTESVIPPSQIIGPGVFDYNYNSTSTVHADQTIQNPNMDDILCSIAILIQTQIVQDASSSDIDAEKIKYHPEFEYEPDEVDAIVDVEFQDDIDPLLQRLIASEVVPRLQIIERFLRTFYGTFRLNGECFIVAMVYVNRMICTDNLILTKKNWRGILGTAIMLAQKMVNDRPFRLKDFKTVIFPNLSRAAVCAMERKAFGILNRCSLRVLPSLYAKYYFNIRDMMLTINRKTPDPKPLSIVMSRRILTPAGVKEEDNRQMENSSDDSHIALNGPISSSRFILS